MTNKTKEQTSNWWKWGDPAQSFHLSDYPKLKQYLEERWSLKLTEDFSFPDLSSTVTEPPYSEERLQEMFPELPAASISIDNQDRLAKAVAQSYHEIIRLFNKERPPLPACVLSPKEPEQVMHILTKAQEHNLKVIPYSGGSNVTGAAEAEEEDTAVVLNMRHLNQIESIDHESLTVTCQTGIYGPDLEQNLNAEGLTLGHFPQSFEYSTLGGWLATRSAGQESGFYGNIEDMVLGATIATPTGWLQPSDYPRHASGIESLPLFLGSEGTLGIITEAKMRVHPLPDEHKWVVGLFRHFEEGVQAVRDMVQSGIHPSITRLSDEGETEMLSKFSREEPTGASKMMRDLMKRYLNARGYEQPSILMMRFPVHNFADEAKAREAARFVRNNDGQLLPSSSAGNWEKNRFSLPYLRDTLIQHRVLIDTFETATYWSNLLPLYNHIHHQLQANSNFFEKGGILFCHISHIYETGASLYFTVLAPHQQGAEVQQWRQLKEVATTAVYEGGGAVSHHHGIGKDHRKWYLQDTSDEIQGLLQTVKNHLDPDHILNPGKLFDEAKKS